MTKAEKERLARLKGMECIACGGFPTEVHHMINQDHKKRDHMRTIPLCGDWSLKWGCHRGPLSIHRTRKEFRETYGSEELLLIRVNELLAGGER